MSSNDLVCPFYERPQLPESGKIGELEMYRRRICLWVALLKSIDIPHVFRTRCDDLLQRLDGVWDNVRIIEFCAHQELAIRADFERLCEFTEDIMEDFDCQYVVFNMWVNMAPRA